MSESFNIKGQWERGQEKSTSGSVEVIRGKGTNEMLRRGYDRSGKQVGRGDGVAGKGYQTFI